MVIVFYDANEEKFYIASTTYGMKIVRSDDENLMDCIPNDDILYVTNGHYFTKQQFEDWLSGNMEVDEPEQDQNESLENKIEKTINKSKSEKRYIHPTANGTIRIEDIDAPKFPGGVELSGKWDFVAVDDIGVDKLAHSAHFRLFLKKGKLAIVDEEYVQKHQHKVTQKKSPAELALDRLLIKNDRPGTAEQVAVSGGAAAYASDDVAVPIMVE